MVNDSNGHLAGDKLLQRLVDVVETVLRSTDILCRYGGEEFAIICCETPVQEVGLTADKVREAVEGHKFAYGESQPKGKVTLSFGAAYYRGSNMSKEDLIRRADQNLYVSKRKGRNTITYQ